MSRDRPTKLVVGADSLVGAAVLANWRDTGECAAGTTRRPHKVDESHPYLDLSGDVRTWKSPNPVSVAVICAGETRVEACKLDPLATARVNVDATSALIGNLVKQGAFVIFLSSNRVFDGSIPFCRPEEPVSPATEYGRQKAETERLISKWGNSVAIVRFTKILEPNTPRFETWGRALKKNERIHPASDIYMSPVPLTCAVSITGLVADLRLPGIWHVSGGDDISYADAARVVARMLNVDGDLIQPVEVASTTVDTEPEPRHTALNIDRLKSILGVVPPGVGWTIRDACSVALGAKG